MGADTEANTRAAVRVPGGPLERLQRRVALEALRESGSSFGTKFVVSQTASTGAEAGQTFGGGGALEVGDLRLLESGSERGGALVSDLILSETVSEWWRGDVVREQASVSTGADTKVNTSGAAAHLRLVIFVSLRTAASTVAPSALMWLRPRLRARDRMGNGERVGVSMGADTKANTSGAAAHLRLVIFVSLRMAASAVAPSTLMLLPARLRARGIGWEQRESRRVNGR
eukprot:scaffold6809_cov56-Phaeocystis_antarctica.AAC.2